MCIDDDERNERSIWKIYFNSIKQTKRKKIQRKKQQQQDAKCKHKMTFTHTQTYGRLFHFIHTINNTG